LRVYAKFSPDARYGVKSWRKPPKMGRNDSTSIVRIAAPFRRPRSSAVLATPTAPRPASARDPPWGQDTSVRLSFG
jgi:hypothetical protein